jgi:hypothetical protein
VLNKLSISLAQLDSKSCASSLGALHRYRSTKLLDQTLNARQANPGPSDLILPSSVKGLKDLIELVSMDPTAGIANLESDLTP